MVSREPAACRCATALLLGALLAACEVSVGTPPADPVPDAMADAMADANDPPDGTTPMLCPALGEAGMCDGNELVFCEGETERRLDCASVGGACEIVDDRAECTMGGTRAGGCADVPELGTCEGTDLRYCASSFFAEYVEEIPCAAYGQACDPEGATDGGAICVPHGPCPAGLDENGTCEGNELRFCEDGELYRFDCGVDVCGEVEGFYDCFVPGTLDGCGTETPAGRCDGEVLVSCRGDVVTREDCAALGLTCAADADADAACVVGDCTAECPEGHTCSAGRCVPSATPERDWTFMVYIVGDNNLSTAAWDDLNEMERVGSSTDVAVVTQVEFADHEWYSYRIPEEYRQSTYRLLVEADNDDFQVTSLAGADDLGNVNMSDPAQLTEFIRASVAQYPARHYALVLWDHGLGFGGGFQDMGDAGEMTLRDLLDGVRDSGVHLDVLEFDACLMAMHEVGLAFRGVADILVGSEEVEPGSGDPYDTMLAPLVANPAMTPTELANVIVGEYMESYSSPYRFFSLTKSALDLREIDELSTRLASVARELGRELIQNRGGLRLTLGSEDLIRYRLPNFADMGSVLDVLVAHGGPVATESEALRTWLDGSNLVVGSQASGFLEPSTGLSIFLPGRQSIYGGPSVQDYREITSPYPLEPWGIFLANLAAGENPEGAGQEEMFSAVLSWGNEPGGFVSEVDLDLHVYEPGGHLASPAIGSVSTNGFLSIDSQDSGFPLEVYSLSGDHAVGSYIVLVHYYGGPPGEVAHPTLTIDQAALPGGYRTLTRGRITERELELVPMSADMPLDGVIDEENLEQVMNLEYSNVWYATVVEVER